MGKKNKKIPCYCRSQKLYKDCCFPFISGRLKPEIPEQLMRSRYSAFCIKDIDYLISTHHRSKRQLNERELLTQRIHETQWLGLKILKTDKSQISQGIGYVEFVAFYKSTGEGQLHENSKFIYENEQWYYLDGVILEPFRFGRNEECWCGSKKKKMSWQMIQNFAHTRISQKLFKKILKTIKFYFINSL